MLEKQKAKKRDNKSTPIEKKHVHFGKIEGLIEEEKVMPFSNGPNINDISNNGLGISLIEEDNLNDLIDK